MSQISFLQNRIATLEARHDIVQLTMKLVVLVSGADYGVAVLGVAIHVFKIKSVTSVAVMHINKA